LQLISIQHVSPKFDIINSNSTLNYNFDYDEIKDERLIKNAIAKSLRYREVSINMIKSQMEIAITILSSIDKILSLSN